MPTTALQTVLISAGTTTTLGAAAQYLAGRFSLDYQLRRQHNQEQRRNLYELISRYHGRVLEAALDWDRRAVQIHRGRYDMLDPDDDKRLDPDQYYYQSVIFRFLQLMAIARRFEAEAFYFDARIAKDRDFDLLRYAKAFLWVMIHAELSPRDGLENLDHFRSDAFRPLLDLCYAEPVDDGGHPLLPATRSRQGELIFDRERCMAILHRGEELGHGRQVRELLEFFDGIRPDEFDATGRQRRRWDRLVALHLLVLAFVHKCGYSWHREEDFASTARAVADLLLDPQNLAEEFARWLPRLGLGDDEEIALLLGALARAAGDVRTGEADADRVARVNAALERFQAPAPAPERSPSPFRWRRRRGEAARLSQTATS